MYEDVRRGFQREPPSLLDDVRISMGDDLGDFIDQYRDEGSRPDPPSYEPGRRDGVSVSPALPEKSKYCVVYFAIRFLD